MNYTIIELAAIATTIYAFILVTGYAKKSLVALVGNAAQLIDHKEEEPLEQNTQNRCNDCIGALSDIDRSLNTIHSKLNEAAVRVDHGISRIENRIGNSDRLLEDIVSPLESLVSNLKASNNEPQSRSNSALRHKVKYADWKNQGGA